MIRDVSELDYDILNKMYLEIFKTNISFSDTFNFKKVYVIDNKIVGFIDYSIIYERAELNYIYVVDTFRNNGIASKLLANVFSSLKKQNILNISLEVNKNNQAAINLYQKNGFKIEAIRKNYYKNGDDAYLMVRVVE